MLSLVHIESIYCIVAFLVGLIAFGTIEWIIYAIIAISLVRVLIRQRRAGHSAGCLLTSIVIWILIGLLCGPCHEPPWD